MSTHDGSEDDRLIEFVLQCPQECVTDHELAETLTRHNSLEVTTGENMTTTVHLAWDTTESEQPKIAVGDDFLTPDEARMFARLLTQHANRAEHGTPIPLWTIVRESDRP